MSSGSMVKMTTVRFESSALAQQGDRLAVSTTPTTLPGFSAPSADPVATTAMTALNAHVQALALVVDHSSAVRAHGGAAVVATAGVLAGIDADNAAAISAVAGGGAPGGATGTRSGGSAPLPPAPSLPAIPAPPAVPVLSGELWSALIHGGPGSSGLRGFADALRAHAGTLDAAAAEVGNHGRGVDEAWCDGTQQAGANTVRHGRWMGRAAERANTIAAAADRVADSFDGARRSVPPPNEFQRARRDILNAQATGDLPALAEASQRFGDLQTQALDGVLADYHPTTAGTLTGLPQPLAPAPVIAPGGGPDPQPVAGPDDVIVGPRDKTRRVTPVDNPTQPVDPVPAEPGGQPQIGPFPVPPQVAAHAPEAPPPAPTFTDQYLPSITSNTPPPAAPPMPASSPPQPFVPDVPGPMIRPYDPPPLGQCIGDHVRENVGTDMVKGGFSSGLQKAALGGLLGAGLTPELAGAGAIPGAVLGFVGGFAQGVFLAPVKSAAIGAWDCYTAPMPGVPGS